MHLLRMRRIQNLLIRRMIRFYWIFAFSATQLARRNLFRFMNGAAFELALEFVTVGNVEDFLLARKSEVDPQIYGINYTQVISQYSDCPVTHIYFVLEPKSKYQDPLDCFAESSRERTIEKIFNLEIKGIKEDSVRDYDRDKIDSFTNSITFRDGCYFVNLPCNEDKLLEVSSNYQVVLNVLDRVVTKLEKQNLYDNYCKVFLDQGSEGIIEGIDVTRCKWRFVGYIYFVWFVVVGCCCSCMVIS